MKTIASFTVDHLKLLPGIYVSRKDKIGSETVTTFDIRVTRPNCEPVMETGEIHTIEHLGATYLRNRADVADQIIYFGPMGCRTGFYLLMAGDLESEDIVELIRDMFAFITDFEGEIPGARPEQCGNYSDQDLDGAKKRAERYLNEVIAQIGPERLHYAE